ncbi:nuclear transport factor 2 family protein [Telluribacter sp.]|jgi:ketosteroid isomerase-like protein|uniref:nuclear transport factor 2 family protein n=1 Tax=Telluribacter sp. TaxID=1978767 RepID=UPI002E107AC4|nr:nuclear transport factor 2 family protein [Telluribacter sp.]
MKNIVFTCFLLLSTLSTYAQSGNFSTNDPTASASAFFEALLNEDGTTLSRLLTPDFGIVSFDGSIIDGGTLTQSVAGGYIVIDTGTLYSLRTRTYGDAAVTNGTWRVSGKFQGNGFNTEVVFTVVSVRQGGSWKVASVQMTPIR